MMTRGRRIRPGIVVAICVALALALVVPTIVIYMRAMAVLVESNGSRVPWMLQPVLDNQVTAERVTIPVSGGGSIAGMLYTPVKNPNAAGLVIVPGLDPGGMDSLRTFGRLEASTGLRVLTPDIPPLKTYSVGNINMSDVTMMGESCRWLAHRTGRPVSLMGISFAGGLALVTAGEPQYASSIRLVLDVGGYDDLSRVVQFYVTGTDRGPDGENAAVHPSRWVQYFLEYTNLSILGTPTDIAALQPILKERILEAEHHPKGEEAKIAARIGALNPVEAGKLAEILDERNEKQEFLELENERQPLLRQVSPHGNMENLTASVYILHGLYDDVIPSEEALWLQKDLPPGRLQLALISPLISHVNIQGKSVGWKDKWRLVFFMYRVQNAMLAPYAGSMYWEFAVYLAQVLAALLVLGLLVILGFVVSVLASELKIWRSEREKHERATHATE